MHRDYEIEHVAKVSEESGCPPASVMVSIMPGTKLRVFRLRPAEDPDWDLAGFTDVHLAPNQCLLFRGDMSHCGLAYSESNFRVHIYVAEKKYPWKYGDTFPVTFKTFPCDRCGKVIVCSLCNAIYVSLTFTCE